MSSSFICPSPLHTAAPAVTSPTSCTSTSTPSSDFGMISSGFSSASGTLRFTPTWITGRPRRSPIPTLTTFGRVSSHSWCRPCTTAMSASSILVPPRSTTSFGPYQSWVGAPARLAGQHELRHHRRVVRLRERDVGGEGHRLVVKYLVVDLGVRIELEQRAGHHDVVQQLSPPVMEQGVPGRLRDGQLARDHDSRGQVRIVAVLHVTA